MTASLKYTINISLSVFLRNSQASHFTYQSITISINKSHRVVVDCLTIEEIELQSEISALIFKVGQKKIRTNKYSN